MTGLVGWADDRRRRLREPHVAALNALVRKWTAQEPDRQVPWFDPEDGGTAATVLLLLEAPGPGTTATSGSGLCSEDNSDPTNRLLKARRSAAGLPRSACVKWNAVPWGSRAPYRANDLGEASRRLREVLAELTDLRLAITFGGTAAAVLARATTHSDPAVLLPALAVPHPSQRNTHARQDARERLDRALRAAALVSEAPPTSRSTRGAPRTR